VACGSAWLPNNAWAQETQRQKQEQSPQQNEYHDQTQSLQRDQQQHDLKAYRGQISSKHNKYYLQENYSKASYLLQDTWEAKKFVDKKVRVTGWLDTEKDILHVVSMAQAP
jgi:hypothetical protein